MNKIWNNIKSTMLAGIFFLVPLGLVLIVILKIFNWIRGYVRPLNERIMGDNMTGRLVLDLVVIIVLVIICFLAGLVARTQYAKNIVSKAEGLVLSKIPGYEFMRNIAESFTGYGKTHEQKVVLVRIEDGWQIGFLVEQIDEENFAVYVPGCPTALSGALYYMRRENLLPIQMTEREALRCLRKMGLGSAELLRGKMNRPDPQKETQAH